MIENPILPLWRHSVEEPAKQQNTDDEQRYSQGEIHSAAFKPILHVRLCPSRQLMPSRLVQFKVSTFGVSNAGLSTFKFLSCALLHQLILNRVVCKFSVGFHPHLFQNPRPVGADGLIAERKNPRDFADGLP